MRAMAAMGLAFLLLASGCSSLLAPASSDPATATLTPAPAPTLEATYPPGVRADSVSAFGLLDAHAAALDDRSYTVTETRTLRDRNGSVRASVTERNRVAADGRRYHYTRTVAGRESPQFVGGATRLEIYANGSLAARRVVATNGSADDATLDDAGRIAQGLVRNPDGGAANPNALLHGSPRNVARLASLVARSGFTVERTDDRYRLTATTVEGDHLIVAGQRVENVTVTEFTLVVAESGLVERARLEFRGTVRGEPVTGVETIAYASLGETTPGEPAWFEAATRP